MVERKSVYTKARNIFLALFLLSTSVVIVLAIFGASMSPTEADPSINGNADVLAIGGLVAIASSCITSLVTFVGFVSTTILAWRKEAREKEDRELERKRKEIELEKQRLELEKIRAEQKDQVQK